MSLSRRVVLIVFLLFAAMAAYWLARNPGSQSSAEELLPADTLLFVQWNNMVGLVQGVEHNPVLRQLWQKDFSGRMRQLGMEQATTDYLVQGAELLRSLNARPLVQALLWQRGMLALLPNGSSEQGFPESFLDNLVFILPGSEERFFREIKSLGDPAIQERSHEYQGGHITQTSFRSGYSLYASEVDGFTLYAFALAPLQRCLDQALARMIGGVQAVHGQKSWLTRQRLVPGEEGEFFLYADAAALRAQPWWQTLHLPPWSDILPQQFTLARRVDGRTNGLNATVRFDGNALSGWLSRHNLALPAQPPVSASQDKATLLHLWSNWFTPEVLDRLVAAIDATELGAPLLAAARSFPKGKAVAQDDFHRLFAPEAGLVIREEKNQNGQFKPLFSLYFRCLDTAAVDSSLRQLLSAFPLGEAPLEQGATATTISMAGGMIQPAFLLMGRHLILADNLHMVQQMAKGLRQGGERRSGDLFQAKNASPLRASFYLFLRNKQVSDALTQLLQFFSEAKNEKGVAILSERQKIFVRQIALPVVTAIGAPPSSRFVLAVEAGEVRASWQSFED